MSLPPVAVRWCLAALTCLGATTACSDADDDGASSGPSTVAPTTTIEVDDGALLLGAVLPRGGTAPDIGGAARAAVQLAVAEINASGGVLGQRVRVITREEGDDPTSALVAVQDLVQLGVDAIVGPTSSINVLGSLRTTVEAGVLTCSPTASAMSLDGFPDNGLFFRTVPSDSLQAQALARLVDDTGSSRAVVVALDDAYGRPFSEATQEALHARDAVVTASFEFSPTDASIAATVELVAALKPETVVVIADGASGPLMISAIDDAVVGKKPIYIVNDAVRRPASSVTPFGRLLARRVMGASPLAFPLSTTFVDALHTLDPGTSGLFAENAYNCVNLIALAAQASGSTLPADIATAVPNVSDGGSSCVSFMACNAVLEDGRNPDYDGPDGVITLDDEGNTTAATFERFSFDESGRDVGTGSLTIGSG